MNKRKNKRKKIFTNKMHREIFLLVFLISLLPTVIVAICFYYLIFSVTASQFAFPNIAAHYIIPATKKVILILSIVAPVSILVMLIFIHKITHKIIGPLDRIVRELDECVKGNKKGHIVIRKTDKFWPLVHRINKLLDKG